MPAASRPGRRPRRWRRQRALCPSTRRARRRRSQPARSTTTASECRGVPQAAAGAVARYDVQYREGSSGPWTLITSVVGASHQIDGLDAETRYQTQVRAVNAGGSSGWAPTPPAEATTTVPPVTAPARLARCRPRRSTMTASVSAGRLRRRAARLPATACATAKTAPSTGSPTPASAAAPQATRSTAWTLKRHTKRRCRRSMQPARRPGRRPRRWRPRPSLRTLPRRVPPTSVRASAIDENSMSVSWRAPTTGRRCRQLQPALPCGQQRRMEHDNRHNRHGADRTWPDPANRVPGPGAGGQRGGVVGLDAGPTGGDGDAAAGQHWRDAVSAKADAGGRAVDGCGVDLAGSGCKRLWRRGDRLQYLALAWRPGVDRD